MERLLVQVLDGRWEVLGVDRDPLAKPVAISPTWNTWGSDTLSFTLDRSLSIDQPDLQAFTPIRWEVDGRVLWSGFTIDTPGAGGGVPSLTVQCLGWQHAFDDDAYAAMFVHSDLTEWKDSRSFGANPSQLSRLVSNASVTEGGNPVLVWPRGSSYDPNSVIGITFDGGPDPTCWADSFDLLIETIGSALTANFNLYVRLHDSMETLLTSGAFGVDRHDAVSMAVSGTSWGGTLRQTNLRRRFVTILYVRNAAAPVVTNGVGDQGIRILKMNLYGKSAYRSGTSSILKVSDIVADVIARVPVINPSTALVTPTSLNLQGADWRDEEKTPREIVEQWNAYHRYRPKLDPDLRFSYTPQPARAAVRCSPGRKGVHFQDASANSGRDLYNKVVVRGQSGSGKPLRVERRASQAIESTAKVLAGATLQAPNPSADVNATGWVAWQTGGGGAITIVRDTVDFDTAPGSIKMTQGAAILEQNGVRINWAAGGVFKANEAYTLDFAYRATLTGDNHAFSAVWGDVNSINGGSWGVVVTPNLDLVDSNVWKKISIVWAPLVDTDSANVLFYINYTPSKFAVSGNPTALWIDTLAVSRITPTVLDRRGRVRTKALLVGSPIDEIAAQLLGDAFLQISSTAPLKGAVEVSGDQGVTEILSGRPIPASDLGSLTGELILLDNLIDPDTGTLGRIGTIAAVSYNNDVATLAIDNQRDNFEALLSRMGIVQS